MVLNKAIERCKKFTTEHKLFNIKEADNLEEAIDTVLNELNNRIPREELKKILDKFEHQEANEDTAMELFMEIKNLIKN